ncbi:MAG: NlpC/P60 family protein [Armatimonadetes bacterium]|nr:NlpC/P60 family protein [Armatimonadota bacterium]
MTNKGLSTIAVIVLLMMSSLASSVGAATHKVRKGDTLWDLAARHHTTPRQIARANGISENSTLRLGKKLRIPGSKPSRKHAVRVAWRHKAVRKAHTRYAAKPVLMAKAEAGCDATASGDQSRVIQTALACRGARYRRGGTSRGGFDCSGFTRYVYAKYGISLPHSSAAQANMGTPVSRGQLKEGDLVFFHTYRRGVSHVGIYIGGNQFVHAATYGRGVRVDSLGAGYYANRYMCARRVK